MWPPDDRIRRAFAETARKYDDLARRRFRRIAMEVIRAAEVKRRDRVLDVACGTGLVARALKEKFLPEPIGIDISAEMLEMAPMGRRVAADALHLPIGDASFDCVICSLGLQMLADPDVGLIEMLRVLRPGGRLGLATWGAQQSSASIDRAAFEVLDSILETQSDASTKQWQTVQIVVDTAEDLGEALNDCGFTSVDVTVRRKRSAYRDANQYFEVLKIFPGAWARLDAISQPEEVTREAVCSAIESAVGHPGHFEVTEEVLIASARRPG